IAGEPMYLKMPKVLGVRLEGAMPEWVSAKDLVLEMLRRYDVKGCRGMIIEYYGPGLRGLSTMDRHVIANMGTEMGATTTVFPSDEEVRRFMKQQGREEEWHELQADEGAAYDLQDELILDDLVPMVALPSSPGNVVPVTEVEGREIYQSYIGSSANPGFRDFWIASEMVKGRRTVEEVSFDINPTSRQILENMVRSGVMLHLVQSGARIHQAGCNGCIGMGQAPATGKNSLRTVPRNFPDRSGTREDAVYLVSPETAAASALTGQITDPRRMGELFRLDYPDYREPDDYILNREMLVPPSENGKRTEIVKGPNISSIPDFDPIRDFEAPVLLKMGDNISTDEILKAGAEVLPFRSNIPEISRFAYTVIDDSFYDRAMAEKEKSGGHVVVAGENYAQGSSREHAAIAPRFLGQHAVLAVSYARIGWQNLVNFGILPLEFSDPNDLKRIDQGDLLKTDNIREQMKASDGIEILNRTKGEKIIAKHSLSGRQLDVLLEGGMIRHFRKRKQRP
ncbi:MAG: aconitate hydratase, partial [Balneolaceae bacterium]